MFVCPICGEQWDEADIAVFECCPDDGMDEGHEDHAIHMAVGRLLAAADYGLT
jgi:hypothetical protein